MKQTTFDRVQELLADAELYDYLTENKDNPLFVRAIERAHSIGVDDGEENYSWAWNMSSGCSYNGD